MSLEVVDLLDSSEEEGEKKSAPPIDDDSSSSDDDILYAPSFFSQGGSSKSAATSNNNNAANVCKKNDNHENGDGIPKKLTIKEQCGEDQVDGRNTAASKAKTNYYPTFGPQRGTSIKPDDEIIEVGSSSDEDFNPILRAPKATEPPEVSKKGQDEFNDSDDDDCIALDQSKLSSGSFCNNENWCTLQENANSHENVVHSSYKPASPRTKNDAVSQSHLAETSGSDVPLTKQKPISPKNNTFTTTNYTCDSAQSPNTSDFRVHSEDDENTHNNFVEMDKTTRKSADFSFEIHGGFDEVESDSDVDTNPTSTTYQSKHNANTTAQPAFLRDYTHPNRVGVDSDDDSISSVPLFTPRPLKKVKGSKPTKPAVAASAMFASKSGKCLDESSSPEMMTPCAFSPPSNSPLTTFVAKKKVPVPAIPAMPPELIQSIGGKLYPDLKHSFLLALTHHARKARHASYERSIFDSALRSIVVLCLHLNPLRSPEAARRIKGVGGNMYEILKKSTSGPDAKPPFVPKQNKYSCVAGAALVALLELEEENMSGEQYFSMEDLISKVNELLDSRTKAFLNQTIEKYLDPDTLDPNWGQVKKLCYTNSSADFNGPFIKERKKKSACTSGIVFELLDIGREMAVKLREIAKAPPIEHGPLRQLPSDTVDEEFGNVTMSMDLREGGGSGKSLHKMCDHLDTRGVPYVVRELKVADYIWFVGNKLAPVLVERKTADDVAASLHDGRWEKQQRNMRKAQYILGGGEDRKCQICYIIEGNANKRKVHGGNVGRRSWCQSVQDVENAIEELPLLGFSVMRSKGHLDTIGILAKIAADISWKVKNGECSDMQYIIHGPRYSLVLLLILLSLKSSRGD